MTMVEVESKIEEAGLWLKSIETSGSSQYCKTFPSEASAISALTASRLVGFETRTVKSTKETLMSGTRTAKPSSLPLSSGTTSPTAAAAPVLAGDHRGSGRACTTQIFVKDIGQNLIIGISVNGGQQTFFNAQGIVQCTGHWCQTVGGARGVGDNFMLGAQDLVVDPQRRLWHLHLYRLVPISIPF